jgi:hypothetical protein
MRGSKWKTKMRKFKKNKYNNNSSLLLLNVIIWNSYYNQKQIKVQKVKATWQYNEY